MAYTRVSKLIPTSSHALKAPYTMAPQYITVHNTWNDASALSEVAYMTTNKNATSFHVAIDDKHAVEAIPFNRNAWHAGDGASGAGNRKSIGIEICYSKSGGIKYAQAEANAIEYIAHLLKQYGWTIDNVKWHRDWSGKNCPHRILDEGRAPAFRDSITRRLTELNYVAPPKEAVVANTETPKEDVIVSEYLKDAQPSKSLAAEFHRAVDAGITDGTYPTRPATRQEVAVMVLRMYEELNK